MRIALISAMTKEGVIGNQNTLPWHLPEELKYFKELTLGKPVVMGRKTFQSMNERPLVKRQNIVLTKERNFLRQGITVVHSVQEAIKVAGKAEELMIIGGASIYAAFLPLASRLYLTLIHQDYSGDTLFPVLNWEEWELVSQQEMVEFTVKILDRKGTL